MQASNLDIWKKIKVKQERNAYLDQPSRLVKNSKLEEKTQQHKEKLKVLTNFDNQVTKYLSNGHKNP